MSRTLALLAVVAAAVLLWWFTQAPTPPPTTVGGNDPALESGSTVERPSQQPEAAPGLEGDSGVARTDATPLATEEESEVAAEELASVRVQVVDLAGEPRRGVPIVLLREEIWGAEPLTQENTDAEGYVVLQDQRRFGPKAKEAAQMTVGFPFPMQGASKPVQFTTEAWPKETIRLELPDTGSVEVHLLALDGTPWSHPTQVHIAPVTLFAKKGKPIREKGIANTGLEVHDGVARFPHVGLGYRFEVGIPWDPWAKWEIARITGPKEAGESVRVELRATSATPVWELDLVDMQGVALAHRSVLVQWRSWSQSAGSHTERSSYIGSYDSDAEGHLAFPRPSGIQGEVARLLLTAGENEHGLMAYGEVPIPLEQEQHAIDFGRQVLALSEMLVAGSVTTPDGSKLKARIEAQDNKVSPLADLNKPNLDLVEGSRTIHKEDGSFEEWGVSQQATLLVKVSAEGYLPQSLTVNRGATGLSFVLAPDLGVGGRLSLPEGFAAKEFRVVFRAGIEAPKDSAWWKREMEDTPQEDGQFRIAELKDAAPGYLAVFHQGSSLKVAEFANVVPVPVDGPQDPRLDPVPLSKLYRFHVQATGPGDDSPMLQWARMDRHADKDKGFNFTFSGKLEFVSDQDSAKVAILADGFLYQEYLLQAGSTEVTLQRAPMVQFQAPELPTLPKGYRYSIDLDALDGPDLLDLSTSLPEGIGGGVYPAPMPASGQFSVRLNIRNSETGEMVSVLDGENPWEFSFEIAEEAAGQLIDIPIPVQAIHDALAQAQNSKD